MAKKDLEDLFEIVRPDDSEEIRRERDAETAELFGALAANQVKTS